MNELEILHNKIRACTRYELHAGCKRPVPGDGPSDPVGVLVGEAPGYWEDKRGKPFVGDSGKELDNYLKQFTKVPRELWYITNVVKCRPPNNREPKPEEIEACLPWLMEELFLLEPRIIGLLGGTAVGTLLTQEGVDLETYHGIPYRDEQGGLCGDEGYP